MHRVRGDDRALDVQNLEQRWQHAGLVGLLVDRRLAEHDPGAKALIKCSGESSSAREKVRRSTLSSVAICWMPFASKIFAQSEANRARAAANGAESAERIVRRLKTLNAENRDVRTEIDQAVDRVKTMEGGQAVGILRSVPGIGPAVLAVILFEAFDSIRNAELQALRCYFGIVPVTKRSGRTILVQRRLAANGRLRNAAIQRDKVSRAKYHALRSRGASTPEPPEASPTDSSASSAK